MRYRKWLIAGALAFVAVVVVTIGLQSTCAGGVGPGSHSAYKILAPLTSGNLTIFPVVATSSHNTSEFLTLDEGLRSGDVIVTEAGNVRGLVRRRGQVPQHHNAEVNTLVLVNNSKRPLLLLAGEIVTGGKQDRVIGKDRIVPPESEPIDLGVFCVEPGRWVASSENFGAYGYLAQPSVRLNAMAKKDQHEVWDSVQESRSKVAQNVPSAAPEVNSSTSYAKAMGGTNLRQEMEKITAPLERDYRNVLRDLRERNAVGVVVAVNGEILWADLFASTDLLDRYWPKLVRSYAAEALSEGRGHGKVTEPEAQEFVDRLQGRHETAETEPGIYRHAEITGDDYKVFELTSLLPKTDYEIHIAKMYDAPKVGRMIRSPYPVR